MFNMTDYIPLNLEDVVMMHLALRSMHHKISDEPIVFSAKPEGLAKAKFEALKQIINDGEYDSSMFTFSDFSIKAEADNYADYLKYYKQVDGLDFERISKELPNYLKLCLNLQISSMVLKQYQELHKLKQKIDVTKTTGKIEKNSVRVSDVGLMKDSSYLNEIQQADADFSNGIELASKMLALSDVNYAKEFYFIINKVVFDPKKDVFDPETGIIDLANGYFNFNCYALKTEDNGLVFAVNEELSLHYTKFMKPEVQK